MTPFLRLALSLTLTLGVWGPNAIDEFAQGTLHLAHLLMRFIVTFAFFRVSVWGVSVLLDSYRASVESERPVVVPSANATGERRRVSNGELSSAGTSTPSLPSGSRNSLGT